jgi:hypothetical protein
MIAPLMTNSDGIAIGVGANADGDMFCPPGIAIGPYARGYDGSVAIGYGVTNYVENSTLVRGVLRTTGGISMEGLNMDGGGGAITNAGRVSTTNLDLRGGSPVVGAVMMAAGTSGDCVWGTNRSYGAVYTTQTTNTRSKTVTCGFRPTTVICFASVKNTRMWSAGFYAANNVAYGMNAYNSAAGDMMEDSVYLAYIHTGGGGWVIQKPAITATGICYTGAVNGVSFTTNVEVRMLFLQ